MQQVANDGCLKKDMSGTYAACGVLHGAVMFRPWEENPKDEKYETVPFKLKFHLFVYMCSLCGWKSFVSLLLPFLNNPVSRKTL